MAIGTVVVRMSEVIGGFVMPAATQPSCRTLGLHLDDALQLAIAAGTPFSRTIDLDRDTDWDDALSEANNQAMSVMAALLPGRYRLVSMGEYKAVYHPITNQIIGHISTSAIVDDASGTPHESDSKVYGKLVGAIVMMIGQ